MLKKLIAAAATLPIAAAGHAGEVYRFDKVKWQPAGIKGVEMAVLWGKEEDGSAVYAFRIQPGVIIPAHTHTRDYWGVAVQGTWVHIDANGKKKRTGQDAYVRIRGNDLHADSCEGPKPCINILDFDGARDMMFPKR